MATKRASLLRAVSGGVSLSALRQQFDDASGNESISVQGWQISSGDNGLTEACTVKAKKAGASIDSVGLLAYSADGVTFYGSQLTEDISSGVVSPALSCGGVKLKPGDQVLGVVFGFVQGAEFFIERVMPVNTSLGGKTANGGGKAAATGGAGSGKKSGATKSGKKP